MGKLDGKVALVTGASQGIGAGIAKSLAAAGAAVVVNYLSKEKGARSVVESINAQGGRAIAVQADLTKTDGAEGLVSAALEAFGKLDIVVNNSGIYEFAPLESVTTEAYRRLFDTNVLGLVLTTKAASRHLSENGSIVNIGSNATMLTMPTSALYAGSKAAVESITRVLSKELGQKRIRINTVLPGPVNTETSRSMHSGNEEQLKMIVGMTPLGRMGEPDDIASVVSFLASDDARWVTGATLLASGGL